MSYYWFNRQEILLKAKERYYKEKAVRGKRVLCTKQRSYKRKVIKTCQKKKKTRLRSTKEKSIKNCFSIKKKR